MEKVAARWQHAGKRHGHHYANSSHDFVIPSEARDLQSPQNANPRAAGDGKI